MTPSADTSLPDRNILRVFRALFAAPFAALAFVEYLALLASPPLAYAILGMLPSLVPVLPTVAYATVQLVVLLAMGLYSRRQRARFTGILLRVATALALGNGGYALIGFLIRPLGLWRSVFVTAVVVELLLIVVIRYAFEAIVNDDVVKRRILVFGAGKRAMSVTELRRRADTRGFRVVGYIASEGEQAIVDPRLLARLEGSLLASCLGWEIDEIVVAMDDRRRAFPVHELLECKLAGIVVTEIVDFLESETGKVRLDVLNPSWIIFAPGFSRSAARYVSGRLLDLIAAGIILTVASPVMLLAAIAIKLEDGLRAPVLYRQTRVGFEGRHFEVLKFRSMHTDAERGGQAVWATKGDARVTRVGALMRKTRIDELPQVWNVLRGDMSLVGPRPERPEFVREFELRIPYYSERHVVKPGITGWAQLCYPYGSSEQDAAEKLQYDLYYVKNHSLIFDLLILLQTAEVVLWGKGAR